MKSLIWKDHKGREVEIHTMTNKWLNNIRKYLPLNNPIRIEIIKEIKKKKKPKQITMNKEFIPYEQSLELKELGFNENCFASYTYDRHNENAMIFDIKEQNGLRWSINTNEQCKQYKEPCTAPLYQQAFRWFREKYKLRFIIQSSMSDLGEYFKLIFPDGEYRGMVYPTYEEAELACLKKLIEIAKDKPQKQGRIQDISIG